MIMSNPINFAKGESKDFDKSLVDPQTIYFLEDTQQIFLGYKEYGRQEIFAVSQLPEIGKAGKLYLYMNNLYTYSDTWNMIGQQTTEEGQISPLCTALFEADEYLLKGKYVLSGNQCFLDTRIPLVPGKNKVYYPLPMPAKDYTVLIINSYKITLSNALLIIQPVDEALGCEDIELTLKCSYRYK